MASYKKKITELKDSIKSKCGNTQWNVRTVRKIGTIFFSLKIVLRNVLYLPEFKHNLLYVSKHVVDGELKIIFTDKECVFQYHSNGITLTTEREKRDNGGIYKLRPEEIKKNCAQRIRIKELLIIK